MHLLPCKGGKKTLLTSLTSQSSNWKELVMFRLILLGHSFEACLNVTYLWLGRACWGFVKHQMCGAPVAGRQHWREDPAASRTVDLVRADTDARGHTGQPLCGRHLYTNTHTCTHTWEQRLQQSATVLKWIREPAAVLLLQIHQFARLYRQ